MIDKAADILKNNAGKTISIATVVGVLGLYTALRTTLLSELDVRYCLASDAQQTKSTLTTWIENDLKNKIFLIDLRIQKGTATDEDRAMKSRYESDLEEVRKHKR